MGKGGNRGRGEQGNRNLFFRFPRYPVTPVHLFLLWWPGTESNRRRRPFQGRLPNCQSGLKSTDVTQGKGLMPYGI